MSGAQAGEAFNPYAILHALEDAEVEFILIGALARVLHGSDELAAGVDLTPSPRPANKERLDQALNRLGATEIGEGGGEGVSIFHAPAGRIRCVEAPAGTRGYADLRRRARHLHLGEGLRPQVAAPGDLVRMLEALAGPSDRIKLEGMRRVVELDRGLGLGF
jgi:hypothetical protein